MQNYCLSSISFNFSVCNEYITPWPRKSVGKAGFSQQHVKVSFQLYSILQALLFLSTRGSCVRNSASCVSLQSTVLEELRCCVHARVTQKSPEETTQRWGYY